MQEDWSACIHPRNFSFGFLATVLVSLVLCKVPPRLKQQICLSHLDCCFPMMNRALRSRVSLVKQFFPSLAGLPPVLLLVSSSCLSALHCCCDRLTNWYTYMYIYSKYIYLYTCRVVSLRQLFLSPQHSSLNTFCLVSSRFYCSDQEHVYGTPFDDTPETSLHSSWNLKHYHNIGTMEGYH